MNYITSCPKCDTHFLLNDELIKAHRGKVQCGTCELVFNAKTRLTEVADDVTSADEYQASIEELESENVEEIILSADTHSSIEHFIGDQKDIAIDPEPKIEINAPSLFDDLNSNTSAPSKTVKHPVLLSLFGLLLILIAITQSIYHLRVRIAAEYPQFKPVLMQACAQLHCTIGLPRNLDLVTIGDSDMQEDDNYQSVINFSSSLTNKANYPQAYPDIELTLTDADDKAVIKKIIGPEEYLTTNKKIEAGLAPREVSPVKLALYVHEAEVAGYRILLIY